MKLIVQPDDGATSVLGALNGAKESIQIAIFRCDYSPVEKALVEAVKRGVAVHALIASQNRGGGPRLRGLETRLLAAGAVVARTNTDLSRYHGKYLIVDDAEVYILAYNFTRSDLSGTRSFGIRLRDDNVVRAAIQLFQADSTRQPCTLDNPSLLISPVNARARLARFLEGAKKELLIYDPEVSDAQMTTILRERADAGVAVRILGYMKDRPDTIETRALYPLRLHVRAIVRDRQTIFLGSQSMRRLELDMRREVGVIAKEPKAASTIGSVFEEDWESAKREEVPAAKVAKRVAKEVAKDLNSVVAVVEKVAQKSGADIDSAEVEEAVRQAVKTAVRDAVEEAVTNGRT